MFFYNTIITLETRRELENAPFPLQTLSKAISYVEYRSRIKTSLYNTWVNIPSKSLRSVLGPSYRSIIEYLVTIGLLLVNDSYIVDSYSKSYKVGKTNRLVGGLPPPLPVYWQQCGADFKSSVLKPLIIRDLTCMKFSEKNMLKMIEFEAKKLDIKLLSPDDVSNSETGVFYSFDKTPFKAKVRDTIKKANNDGLVVFKRTNYVIGTLDEVIDSRQESWTKYALSSFYALKNKQIRVQRNKTNRRLDTNITNMPSAVLMEIMKQNDLVQIDLKNSQCAILSSLLPDDDDEFTHFKELAACGELYKFIEDSSRGITNLSGKSIMFASLFGRIKNSGKAHSVIKQLLPKTTEWVKNEKKRLGRYNLLAIELQKRESEVFIDDILTKFKKYGRFCLTKHDSIIIKKSDLDYGIKTVKRALKKKNIKGELRVEQYEKGILKESSVAV